MGIVCKTGKYVYKGVLSEQLLSVKQVSKYTKEYWVDGYCL